MEIPLKELICTSSVLNSNAEGPTLPTKCDSASLEKPACHESQAPTCRSISTTVQDESLQELTTASCEEDKSDRFNDNRVIIEVVEEEIAQLYVQSRNESTALRKGRKELQATRARLAERLYHLHEILSTPGRKGKWSERLEVLRIPHSTGDRLVASHRAILALDSNQPTGLISEPTVDDICRLFKKITPLRKSKLTTSAAVCWFRDEVDRFCGDLQKEERLFEEGDGMDFIFDA